MSRFASTPISEDIPSRTPKLTASKVASVSTTSAAPRMQGKGKEKAVLPDVDSSDDEPLPPPKRRAKSLAPSDRTSIKHNPGRLPLTASSPTGGREQTITRFSPPRTGRKRKRSVTLGLPSSSEDERPRLVLSSPIRSNSRLPSTPPPPPPRTQKGKSKVQEKYVYESGWLCLLKWLTGHVLIAMYILQSPTNHCNDVSHENARVHAHVHLYGIRPHHRPRHSVHRPYHSLPNPNRRTHVANLLVPLITHHQYQLCPFQSLKHSTLRTLCTTCLICLHRACLPTHRHMALLCHRLPFHKLQDIAIHRRDETPQALRPEICPRLRLYTDTGASIRSASTRRTRLRRHRRCQAHPCGQRVRPLRDVQRHHAARARAAGRAARLGAGVCRSRLIRRIVRLFTGGRSRTWTTTTMKSKTAICGRAQDTRAACGRTRRGGAAGGRCLTRRGRRSRPGRGLVRSGDARLGRLHGERQVYLRAENKNECRCFVCFGRCRVLCL